MLRRLALTSITLAFGVAAPLLLAELVLQFLPVRMGLGVQAVDAEHSVAKFEPNRDFVYSRGWNLRGVNRGHINNDGFVNDRDYAVADPRPLLAIIGDSYVEAQMVPYADTMQGRLAAEVGEAGRVYSFGGSGAPLSQYIVWAAYAAQKYAPGGIAIVVVGNDFDESLLKYKSAPAHHFFAELPDGKLELRRIDYHPSWARTLLSHSALARYVILDLQSTELLFRVESWFSGGSKLELVANTSNSLDPVRIADSRRVIPAFLDELLRRTGLPPERLMLVVDGVRPELYSGETAGTDSYFGIMRAELMAAARGRGIEVIDMQTVFAAAYRGDKQRFEFPDDGHWNGHGHGIAAKAIRDSALFRTIFAR